MNGPPDTSVVIGTMKLKTPVMPASGTFGYGQEYSEFIDLNRLGAIVVKTITLKPRVGSYPHRSTEVASGFLANIKLADILNRQQRVDALELNISCPNVEKGGMHFGMDLKVTEDLVKRVRNVTEKSVIVKLTPLVMDIRPFAEICQLCGADGVSLINALVGMAIDIRTRRSKLGRNITGGLAGPAIKPFSLYLVWQACKTVDIPVIGIGGISSAEDAIEFLIAGASAIEVGTWNLVNPAGMVEIIEGIEAYMAQNKIKALSDLIGTLS